MLYKFIYYINVLCVTNFMTSVTMPDLQNVDMRHIW